MHEFTQDNTAGFTDAQLAEMNDEFYKEMAQSIAGLPPGRHDYLIDDISKSAAAAVLKRHGGA